MGRLHQCLLGSATAFYVLCANAAPAEETSINWVLSGALGYKNLEFDEDRSRLVFRPPNNPNGTPGENKLKLDDSLYYCALGVAAALDKFFASASVELPLGESSYTRTQSADGRTTTGDLSRLDASLTVGYRLLQGWSVFAGYKYGETELDADYLPELGLPSDLKNTYEEDGFFVGTSYAFPIGSVGLLSFSVAYADLDADWSQSGSFDQTISQGGPGEVAGPTDYSGDADGFSYSIEWSGSISDSLQYSLAARYQKYELDGDGLQLSYSGDGSGAVAARRVFTDIKTTEQLTTFSVGLKYLL